MKKTVMIFFLVISVPVFLIDTVFTAPIELDDNLTISTIARITEYYIDKDGNQTIDTIKSNTISWNKFNQDAFNFGFVDSVYWFKFSVNNTLNEKKEWYLEIDYPMLDTIDLFMPDAKTGIKKITTGDRHPFHNREINDRLGRH